MTGQDAAKRLAGLHTGPYCDPGLPEPRGPKWALALCADCGAATARRDYAGLARCRGAHLALATGQLPPHAARALAAGLRYFARGWPVFVLGRSKRPVANCAACHAAGDSHDREACRCLTCHGFYAATTDPNRLAAMLAAVPRGLLAIRTGTMAGLAVVDIDPRNGGRIDPVLMAPTATVATGGGGWHLYYRHPGGPLAAKLPGHPGVDIKGDGGYVAAPPSRHPGTGRRYRWAGRWPVAEMPPRYARASPRPRPRPPVPRRSAARHAPAQRGASHHPPRCSPPTSAPSRPPLRAAAA